MNLIKNNYRGHVNAKLLIPNQITLYMASSAFVSIAVITMIVGDLNLSFYSLIGVLAMIFTLWALIKIHNQIVVFDASLYRNVFVKTDPRGIETFLLLYYDLQGYFNLKGINYRGSPVNSEGLVYNELEKLFSSLFHNEGSNVTNLFMNSRGCFFSFYNNLTPIQKETLSRHYQTLIEKISY